MTRRSSLKDIAANLGLSVNAVSRALNDRDGVSDETRAKVVAEAERLSYIPNAFARSLVQGGTRSIGLLVANLGNPFYAEVVNAVERRCHAHGYRLLLEVTNETIEAERKAADSLVWSAADGALIVSTQHDRTHLERLRDSGMPLGLINRNVLELGVDFVGVNYKQVVSATVQHLYSAGARSFALIDDDLPLTTISDRISSFHDSLAAVGLTENAEVLKVPTSRNSVSPLPQGAEDIAREIADRTTRPDAIIATSDYYALAVYRAMAEKGLEIPGDLMVAGLGDYPFSPYLQPPLTSVKLPTTAIGAIAVDLLLERINHSTEPARHIERDALLMSRQSTAKQHPSSLPRIIGVSSRPQQVVSP